jgi:DNA-binding XRE family transcriptional regulator
MSTESDPQVQQELDRIERALHRARGIETAAEPIHPLDFRLPSGGELRQLRERCGLDAQAVADRLDMQRSSIYNIESGQQRPSMKTLNQLLRLYRMEWPQDGDRV